MRSNIKKYLTGKNSDAEQKVLLDWIRQDKHLAEFQDVKKEWKNHVVNEPIPSEHQENWNNIQNHLLSRMQSNLKRTERRLLFFRYAAISIALISIPSILYFYSQSEKEKPLTYTSVSADFGQISKVMLPDSTVIWINSGSTIKYNNLFSTTNRDISLVGEAFFMVHKNKDLPLVVKSEDLRVKVLGTEFSVISYPEDNSIQVILEEGKVELTSSTHSTFAHDMKPGELAVFNKLRKDLTISNVNTGLYTSWKDGMINIYNLPLSELIVKLERRYNQKFVVDSAIRDLPYTFTIKNENLNSILSLMEKITPVNVVQHDNVIELKHANRRKR